MSTGTQIALGVGLALVVFLAAMTLRRRPARPSAPVSGDLDTRLRARVADGRKILAIKELREHTGLSLKDAKDYVDALAATGEPPPSPGVDDDSLARARALAADGKKILAIKEVRERTGMGLKEAKDFVDALAVTGEPPPPVTGLSAETLALARSLVARRKAVLAVKAIRAETGWDLKRCKDIVDRMPRRGKNDDGFGHHL